MNDTLWVLWSYYEKLQQILDHPAVSAAETLLAVVPASLSIREKNPRELYLLCYIFSFFFLLFLALNLSALWMAKDFRDYFGQFVFIYDFLTNQSDEYLLVGGVIYLGVGPQLLAYLLSGPFGCARAPMFVRQIRIVTIYSLVKFLMGLGGIMLSETLAKILFGKAVSAADLTLGILSIQTGFVLAAFHFCGLRWLKFLERAMNYLFYRVHSGIIAFIEVFGAPVRPQFKPQPSVEAMITRAIRRLSLVVGPVVLAVHRFFTRYSEPNASAEAKFAEPQSLGP